MFRSILAFVLVSINATALQAQDPGDIEVVATMRRIQATLRFVQGESKNADSELELLDEQKLQLAELEARYAILVQDFYQKETIENDDRGAMEGFVAGLPKLENKLNTEILLPHQKRIVEANVFEQFVLKQGGNVLRAIADYYPKQLSLSDQQRKQIREIESRASKELAELKRKYEAEVHKVKVRAQFDAKKMLTEKQLETLGKYQAMRPKKNSAKAAQR